MAMERMLRALSRSEPEAATTSHTLRNYVTPDAPPGHDLNYLISLLAGEGIPLSSPNLCVCPAFISSIVFMNLRKPYSHPLAAFGLICASLLLIGGGCGTTKTMTATEQLLMSDAVDSTISKLDFSPLAGQKIYLDTTYVSAAGKAPNTFINSDYVISSIRQQMTAAGCMLVDVRDTAEIICEARCGALGIDGHSVIYGMPANNSLATAASVISGTPSLPSIPEISLAKREMNSAAAKVAVFAYDRQTREPIWQSGISQAGSNSRDTWVMGIGPMQSGTIYNGPRFAGRRMFQPSGTSSNSTVATHLNGVDYRGKHTFEKPIYESKPQLAEQPGDGANMTR